MGGHDLFCAISADTVFGLQASVQVLGALCSCFLLINSSKCAAPPSRTQASVAPVTRPSRGPQEAPPSGPSGWWPRLVPPARFPEGASPGGGVGGASWPPAPLGSCWPLSVV